MVPIERRESQEAVGWCPERKTKVLIGDSDLEKYGTIHDGLAVTGSLSEGQEVTGTSDYLIMCFAAHI